MWYLQILLVCEIVSPVPVESVTFTGDGCSSWKVFAHSDWLEINFWFKSSSLDSIALSFRCSFFLSFLKLLQIEQGFLCISLGVCEVKKMDNRHNLECKGNHCPSCKLNKSNYQFTSLLTSCGEFEFPWTPVEIFDAIGDAVVNRVHWRIAL